MRRMTPAPGFDGEHVGMTLRRTREAMGYDLPALAASLRIKIEYLQALEEGRWGDLPGQAYSTGFLRSYAKILGLDAAKTVERFKRDASGLEPARELYFPEPVDESRIPGPVTMLTAAAAALAVYVGWIAFSAPDQPLVAAAQALPDRLARLIYDEGGDRTAEPLPSAMQTLPATQVAAIGRDDPPGDSLANPISAQGAAPSEPLVARPGSPPSTVGAAGGAATSSAAAVAAVLAADAAYGTQTPPEAAQESEAPQLPDLGQGGALAATEPNNNVPDDEQPTMTQEEGVGRQPVMRSVAADVPLSGRVFGQASGPVRVTIRALEDSWIEIKDAKGTLWASRVLRRGDVFRAPVNNAPGLVLNTGNAGGLMIAVDGRDLPPLGNLSQSLQGVSLSPENLQAP
jgi:cytoskeleton protein RodZ